MMEQEVFGQDFLTDPFDSETRQVKDKEKSLTSPRSFAHTKPPYRHISLITMGDSRTTDQIYNSGKTRYAIVCHLMIVL
jgi:hypothetical protein